MKHFISNLFNFSFYTLVLLIAVCFMSETKAQVISTNTQCDVCKKFPGNDNNTVFKLHHTHGYLDALLDSSGTILCGKKYALRFISSNTQSQINAQYFGFWVKNEIITPNAIDSISTYLVQAAANEGFPFAKISIDSVIKSMESMDVFYSFQMGRKYYFDTIRIQSDNNQISKHFVQQYFNLIPGKKFQYKNFVHTQKRIDALGFMYWKQMPKIEFTDSLARVYIYPAFRNKNRYQIFGGISRDSLGNFQILGNFSAHLRNQFRQGEYVYLQLQALETGTQIVNFQTEWPFLYKLPFGFAVSEYLEKRDSSFLKNNIKLGTVFLLNEKLKIQTGYRYERTIELSSAERGFNGTNANSYFIEMQHFQTDTLPIARKARIVVAGAGIGKRKSEGKNEQNIYLYFHSTLHHPISKYLNLASEIKSGYTANHITNIAELLRLGGTSGLRGYMEQSVPVKNYILLSHEIIWFGNPKLAFFMGYDWMLANKANNRYKQYNGAGIGLRLITKQAALQIQMAVPYSRQNGVNIDDAKWHISISNTFN